MNDYQRKLKAVRLAVQALQLAQHVTVSPTKGYKLVNLDTCDIKPDTQLEWRVQGEDSYANEFTNFDIKE